MTEILHAWALAPAAIGTCCLAADRRRVRAPELAASVLMLLAMLDASLTRLVPAVWWAVLLVAGAIALAALRAPRRRRRSAGSDAEAVRMAVHANVGMIAMAALQLGMGSGHANGTSHAHGFGPAALTALLIVGAVGYALFSVLLAARAHRTLDRVQIVAMATAVGLMAAGAAG